MHEWDSDTEQLKNENINIKMLGEKGWEQNSKIQRKERYEKTERESVCVAQYKKGRNVRTQM